jgi:hypothetical protein
VNEGEQFQSRVRPWMIECFGAFIAGDRMERNHRFFEEATEAVQANGMTRSEAHQLVDYTFDRPVGDLHQEIGGVMVTLAALCLASGEDMHAAAEMELARIWTKVEAIRAKQAAKPAHSPLAAEQVPALTFPRVLTPELREVLGWPNFKCGPVAHVMRAAGADIKTRSEDEQAAVLHWLVTMVLTHGDTWWQAASDELRTMQESIKAKKGASA